MKLGIIVPSNNPIAGWEKHFFKTLHTLGPLLERHEVRVLLNAQPPWTPDRLAWNGELTRQLGFGFEGVFTELDPVPSGIENAPMCWLRGSCALLWPAADVYMFADDNLVFNGTGTKKYPRPSWQRYDEVLDYMETFPNCGSVQCQGFFGGHNQGLQIRPSMNGLISTSVGLFVRNIFDGHLYTHGQMALTGPLEETICVYSIVAEGFFHARQFNNPTRHKMGRHDLSERTEALRIEYGDPTWSHDSKRFPESIMRSYRDNGGDSGAMPLRSGEYCVEVRSRFTKGK